MQHSALLLAAVLQQEIRNQIAAYGSQGQAPTAMLLPAADKVLKLINKLLELMLGTRSMAVLAASNTLQPAAEQAQQSVRTAEYAAMATDTAVSPAAGTMLEQLANLPGLGLLSMHAGMHQLQNICHVLSDASGMVMGLQLEIPGSFRAAEEALAAAASLMDPTYKLLQLQVS